MFVYRWSAWMKRNFLCVQYKMNGKSSWRKCSEGVVRRSTRIFILEEGIYLQWSPWTEPRPALLFQMLSFLQSWSQNICCLHLSLHVPLTCQFLSSDKKMNFNWISAGSVSRLMRLSHVGLKADRLSFVALLVNQTKENVGCGSERVDEKAAPATLVKLFQLIREKLWQRKIWHNTATSMEINLKENAWNVRPSFKEGTFFRRNQILTVVFCSESNFFSELQDFVEIYVILS